MMEGCTPNHKDLLQRPGPNFAIEITDPETGWKFWTSRDYWIEYLQALHESWIALEQKLWYNKYESGTVTTE